MRRSKAFNLPNNLTYLRLAAVPAVVALLFWPEDHWSRWVALAIFVVAGVTDYLDGYFARVLRSNRRSAGCSIRSPTSSWSRPAC